jgi:phosphoglucomutase
LKLSSEWRNAVVKEIGRERYDAMSETGYGYAYAYVDYRIQQMMIDKLVKDRMPKSSVEYIVRKAGEGSLFGISTILSGQHSTITSLNVERNPTTLVFLRKERQGQFHRH